MKSDLIHFVLTGGTIDSYYNGIKDTAVPNKKSVIPDYISSLQLKEKTLFTEVCMKDSRDLTKSDLNKLYKTVKNSKADKIIITCGTYTMVDTARYLKTQLGGATSKVIVFTGSMIPMVGFSPSDAPFNLGYAIAKVQELEAGIYVCMNGKVFNPEEVTKLLYKGKFVSLFGERPVNKGKS